MRIAIIVEGATEKAFLPHLRSFLQARLAGQMPKLDPVPSGGRIPTGEKLRRLVVSLLNCGRQSADAVIALTDVYTGTTPPEFVDAADAKAKLRQWVGNVADFYPHAAQFEFEAWLLPYWSEIQRLADSSRNPPTQHPEQVNQNDPPAKRIQEVFRTGRKGKSYVKQRDASRILRGQDLSITINACPELKSFVNTMLRLCGTDVIA